MKIFRIFTFLLTVFVLILISCNKDEVQPSSKNQNYSGMHRLSIDTLYMLGSSSIKVYTTFNLTFDPTINEAGVMLMNDLKTVINKKVIDLKLLKSNEIILFENLLSGVYYVKSYMLCNNKNDTIFSSTKMITIANIDYAEYTISCSPTYESDDGKAVCNRSNGELVIIYFHTDRELPIEEFKIKLKDGLILSPTTVCKSNFTSQHKNTYNIELIVSDDIPVGLYDVDLIENDITYHTGVQIEKLSGSWERVKSLFPGEIKGGNRIFFQSGKYAYIGYSDSYIVGCSTLQMWQFNLENYQWKRMATLDVSPAYINVKYNSILIGNIAYTLINRYSGKSFELWGYDVLKNSWGIVSICPDVTKTWPNLMVFLLKNKLFIVGSSLNSTTSENTILSYDLLNKKWQNESSFLPFYFDNTTPEYTIFSSNQSIYFYLTVNSKNEFWKYDILNNDWSKLPEPSHLFIKPGGVMRNFNGLFYYFYSGYNCFTFSEETTKWNQIASLPSQMFGGTAFDYNGQLFVGLGYNDLENSYATSVSFYLFKY